MRYEDAGLLANYGFWRRFLVLVFGEGVNWSPIKRDFAYIFYNGRRYEP